MAFCSYSQAKPDGHAGPSSSSFFSKYEGELLSVDIKDAALDEVLQRLSDQTGISFSLPPSLCKNMLMVRFANFDLDEGIDKVLSSYDRVFIYDQAEDKAEGPSNGSLREVRIYIKENNKIGASEQPIIIIRAKKSGQDPSGIDKAENKQVMKTSPNENVVKSLAEWSKDLQEGDEATKLKAVQGLARMGAEGIGPLTSALEDTNPEVSKAAESVLPDIYASLEEENAANESLPPIEGAPAFAIDSTGLITGGSGNQMEVDVRLSDVPEKLITGGFVINYDPAQMSILGADAYDGTGLTGPWDSAMTNKVANSSGPGTYMVIVGNLASVAPDENSTINIARLHINCTGNCDAPITITPVPGFDTLVGNSSTVYDGKMPPTPFKIN